MKALVLIVKIKESSVNTLQQKIKYVCVWIVVRTIIYLLINVYACYFVPYKVIHV